MGAGVGEEDEGHGLLRSGARLGWCWVCAEEEGCGLGGLWMGCFDGSMVRAKMTIWLGLAGAEPGGEMVALFGTGWRGQCMTFRAFIMKLHVRCRGPHRSWQTRILFQPYENERDYLEILASISLPLQIK